MSFQTELVELLKKYDARIYLVEQSVESLKVEFMHFEPDSKFKCLTVEDVEAADQLKIYYS